MQGSLRDAYRCVGSMECTAWGLYAQLSTAEGRKEVRDYVQNLADVNGIHFCGRTLWEGHILLGIPAKKSTKWVHDTCE